MDSLRIEGGSRLRGRVEIGGAKNAALPAMAAALLAAEPVVLSNVPMVRDVATMSRLLGILGGGGGTLQDGTFHIRCARLAEPEAPYDLVKTMRASVLVLGPLTARLGKARVSLPGGCAIGERPVEQHIQGLRALGADVEVQHGYMISRASRLTGADFTFAVETVTGTENLMMAATLARGTTILRRCAREPEIVDLAVLLTAMGARIEGAGTDTIRIVGVDELGGAEHALVPDRIEAGTFVIAGALAGEEIEIGGCRPEHLEALLGHLTAMGVSIQVGSDTLRVNAPETLVARDVRTAPHPGFPTDLQAQFMTLATQARGTSVIHEEIFENRFMHVAELRRMGADVQHDGRTAVVRGPARLSGAQVMATDLRASASLVLAGLVADGTTIVDRIYHLDRGYEKIERKLGGLGARVERVS